MQDPTAGWLQPRWTDPTAGAVEHTTDREKLSAALLSGFPWSLISFVVTIFVLGFGSQFS